MGNNDTKLTPTNILNRSYDPTFDVVVVEPVRRNIAGTAIEFFNPATEETLQSTLFNYKLARLPVPGDTLTYLGYLDKDGNWYITEIDEDNGTQKYVKGTSGFTTAWSNRASNTYLDFDSIF